MKSGNGITGDSSRTSRRGFLKASAAIAGAAALSGPMIVRGEGPKPAASSTDKNSRLNVALIGCGSQGRSDMRNFMANEANIVALCDVDESAIAAARNDVAKVSGDKTGAKHDGAPSVTGNTKAYADYRKLLDEEKSLDAVIIATPDHWHAPICAAAMKAGKHVYCEKPLTHSVADARMLRELSRRCNVVTQMGNQGSAENSMRRALELIRAGVLGQVSEIHVWLNGGGFPHAQDRPEGADPIPAGVNWDAWLGPAPVRPYKKDIYHPFKWRGWTDFGSGQLGDFACHSLNLPLRALDLEYPNKIEVVSGGWKQDSYANSNEVSFVFPSRGKLSALNITWHDGGPKPAADLTRHVAVVEPKLENGVLILGEKGEIYTNPWNSRALIKLNEDAKYKGVLNHEPTKEIATSVPRVKSHQAEFITACRGEGKTFSDFEFGGHLTEIALAGVVALRVGQTLEWDGEKMEATNCPAAANIIKPQWRKAWI